MKSLRRFGAIGLAVCLAFLVPAVRSSHGQAVSAVPKLDLNRYMGVWFVVAQYPVKFEKGCVSSWMVLYALGDKPNTFQMGTSCELKNGSADERGATGKMDKAADGKLKLSRFVLFSTKYWVLATGPNYNWALVGYPDHKALWVLSREKTLKPDAIAAIEKKATEEGFKTSTLKFLAP